MTFDIEKYRDAGSTTIRLIGRMRAEHLSEPEEQITDSEPKIVLNLEELELTATFGRLRMERWNRQETAPHSLAGK